MRSTPGGACTLKHICPYLGATTVSIMTFSITTLSNKGLICGNWHNSIECRYGDWHCAKSRFFNCYAECHHAECCYAEYKNADCCGALV